MDLKVYYRKVREAETSIAGDDVVMVSLATEDGGKAGRKSQVPRRIAAQLMVEGKARPASEEEVAQYEAEEREAKRIADERAAQGRLQLTVISDADLRSLRGSKSSKQ